MEGFKIYNDSIKNSINKAGSFFLMIQDDDFEVFESNIKVGRSIICQPYECIDAINVAIVMEGRLFHTNEGSYIEKGQWFSFKNLEETHHLSVVEEVKLLMVRTKNVVDRQMKMIESVSNLLHIIQEKDQYTEDHCNNTGNLAVQIATIMKLHERTIENILYAGKFHDVGKIDLPMDVLNKPGALTHQEFEMVKAHSRIGSDIVKREIDDPYMARIVLEHHEKLDGSGYPAGLKGDEICMEARVILVADSYDAMTTDRPYRKALTHEQAMNELIRYRGVWYDEKVVDALMVLFERLT